MLSLNYLLLIFVSLWNSLEGTRVANNTNEGIWNNAFLDDPSLVSLFDFEGKNYYTPKLKATFIEAYQFCKNIGMNLVTVQSSQEVDALTKFVQQSSVEQIFWTSGSRLVDNRNWIWMTTMQIVEYTKWSDGQPDLTVEQCLELWFAGKRELYFNNRDCNAKQALICEKYKQTKCSPTLKSHYVQPKMNLLHLHGKSYYFGTTFRATFLQASQFCEAIQMKLVSIGSETENKELHKYARGTLAVGNFWSSGFKFGNGKQFVWLSTGTMVGYSNWSPGQPGNINEMCLELVHNRNEGFFWNDLSCETKLFFICERYDNSFYADESILKPKVNKLDGNSDCWSPSVSRYISPNINLLHFKGKKYYFSTFAETFFQASEFCGMIDMKLVSINSEEENKILYEYIRDTVAGDSFWSSGSRLINGRNLIWLSTGRTVSYTKWHTGQPDNVNEMCIQLIQNRNEGLFWNDFNCEVKLFFICERYDDIFSHDDESLFEPRPTDPPLTGNYEYIERYPENPSLPLIIVGGTKLRLSRFKSSFKLAQTGSSLEGHGTGQKPDLEELPLGKHQGFPVEKWREEETEGLSATQQRASQACRQYGMELISIPNKAKNDFVKELIQRYGLDSDAYYWTSGIKQLGRWTWLGLQPIVYTNWYDNQPHSESNEPCLQLHSSGQWSSLKCDSQLPFVCENRIAVGPSGCVPQSVPTIHLHINSNQGSDAINGAHSQTKKINCSCDGEGYSVEESYFEIIPRK